MVKEWQQKQLTVNQPAGHLENHESLQQAVAREVLEETGWLVEPLAIVGLYAFTPEPDSDSYHRVCFVCQAQQHTDQELDADIHSAVWLTKDEIAALPQRSPLVLQCIEDFENGATYPLALINNQSLTAYN